ncbi:MAG: MFS transporter [Lachnospirales bacterium]
MKSKEIYLFFALVFLEGITANLVHPVTPSLIIALNLPDFIFGLAFACMSTTFMLFSPFWGKMNENIGSRRVLLTCCLGYALGQFFFFNANVTEEIVVARLWSGMFSGGIVVSMMTYIVKISTENELSKNLTIYATLLAVGNATGYLIGGLVGKSNIYLPFYFQVSMLVVLGILFFVVCQKSFDKKFNLQHSFQTFIKSNPINTFLEIKPHLNLNLKILSIITLFVTTATICQDQNFNYYIKDVYNLDSSYNGLIKSMVAILGLLLNSTLCKFIINKLDISISLKNLYFLLSIIAIGIFYLTSPFTFIGVNIVYYGFIIVCSPLLQFLFTSSTKSLTTGILIGYYNFIYSVGMIIGSLSSGALYSLNGKLPFAFCFILLVISSFMMIFRSKNI